MSGSLVAVKSCRWLDGYRGTAFERHCYPNRSALSKHRIGRIHISAVCPKCRSYPSRFHNSTGFQRITRISYFQLDFTRPFEEQGPFRVIVHKLCDMLVAEIGGDQEASRICREFDVSQWPFVQRSKAEKEIDFKPTDPVIPLTLLDPVNERFPDANSRSTAQLIPRCAFSIRSRRSGSFWIDSTSTNSSSKLSRLYLTKTSLCLRLSV